MSMAEKYSVAIDGPSGAGKSTLAKAAAAALGICYVDTGAIYRTIGYGVYRRGINPSDAGAVAAVLPDMQLEMRYDQAGLQRMMLAGEDVTDQIRLPEMSRYASTGSAIPVNAIVLSRFRYAIPGTRKSSSSRSLSSASI